MIWSFSLTLFLLGLAVGSFLNVIIWRYRPGERVFALKNIIGRSHCPYCGKTLSWTELIPLFSFLLQRGRCRACGHSLSWQYPLVELLSGLILAALPFYLNVFYLQAGQLFVSLQLPNWYYGLILAWVAVFLVWLIMTVVDWRHFVIPDELNVLLAILGVIISLILIFNQNFFWPFHNSFLRHYSLVFSPFGDEVIFNRLLGAAVGAGFFALLYFLSRGRALGFGDVKLALASGLILGWPDIGLAMMISFVLGGIFGALMLISGRKTMKDRIAFGPFLAIGSVLTVFLGYQIIGLYFSLFGVI